MEWPLHCEVLKSRLDPKQSWHERAQKYYILVETWADWEQNKARLLATIQELPMITIDTERKKSVDKTASDAEKKGSLNLITVGVASGWVWILCVESLKRAAPNPNLGLKALLPPKLLEILRDPGIYKIGSGIRKDVLDDWEPCGVDLVGLVDTQDILRTPETRQILFPRDELNEHLGLSFIAQQLFGCDYRPLKNKAFRDAQKNKQKLPWYKTYKLYDWPELARNFCPRRQAYLMNDGLMPLAFILFCLIQVPRYVKATSLRGALNLLFEDYGMDSTLREDGSME